MSGITHGTHEHDFPFGMVAREDACTVERITTAEEEALMTEAPKHMDANGVELHVGDVVQLGLASGSVLLLEDWPAVGSKPRTAGVYVSNLGTWGDARAVEAARVTRVEAA